MVLIYIIYNASYMKRYIVVFKEYNYVIQNDYFKRYMNIYDIIVVGLGSHGSACFDHLSTKFKVLGIEQFVSPHNRGTHNGETRLVRDSWYIEPEYC